MAQIDLILTEHSPGEIRVNIVGEALPSGALSERVVVDRAEVDQISEQITRDLLDWANRPTHLRAGPPVRESIRRSGLALYQTLFGGAGDAFRDLKHRWVTDERYCIVHLDEELVHLPVELCHDGDAFLSETFLIGRRVAAARADRPAPSLATGSPRLLLLVNPSEDPLLGDSAEEELREIRKAVREAGGIELQIRVGRTAQGRLLDQALPGAALVHLIGHQDSDADQPDRNGWRLFGRRWYGPSRVLRLQDPPRIVFANACASARAVDWKSSMPMVRAFLERGTEAYVGTWWEVGTPAAAAFAAVFYHSLAYGETVGIAMTRAREKVLEEFGPDEAAWASYILYGDPRARLPQTPAATGKPRRIARPLALVGILMAIGILLPSTLGQRAKDAGTAVEEPAATPSGYLTFESEPPGAAVWIDGHQRGATPLTLELDEGTHEVALDLPGHALWEASALVDPDSPQVIHVQLEEAPR